MKSPRCGPDRPKEIGLGTILTQKLHRPFRPLKQNENQNRSRTIRQPLTLTIPWNKTGMHIHIHNIKDVWHSK